MQAYPHYPRRNVLDLNGFWEFSWLGAVDWGHISPEAFRPQTVMAVPGVFDTLPQYGQKRGAGMYRKRIPDDFSPGERLQIRIDGMGLFGRVWFDGEHLGDCELPYSSVQYEISVRKRGSHELVIAVDNRFDPERVPLFDPQFDFYAFGGLYRGVELHRLPACALERVRVTPLDLDSGMVGLAIALNGAIPPTCNFDVSFDGGSAQHFERSPRNGRIEVDVAVPNPRIWSPDSPHLHIVEVSIPGDSIRERFGLRTVATAGQQILLNGEPVELRGFNRHESHPELGPSLPHAIMLEDVQWLKAMNCNFVRCVHYPHSEAFLDLCDETGIMVWAESLGWGNRADQLANQRFGDLQERQTRQMVRNSFNHPSVLLWAFLNEGDSSSEKALPLYTRLAGAIREEDPSRLVSYASNRGKRDRCFALADVIALNGYPGWIDSITIHWETRSIDTIAPYVSEMMSFFSGESPLADKPLLFSEIGACALYGCHDLAGSQWTEEFQAEYMVTAARAILENPRACGIALWQLFDTRAFGPSGQVRTKPRGMNNAGVLDEYRRPKLARAAIGEFFGARGSSR